MAHLNRANAFWAEMSACEHFVQIYESEEVFMVIRRLSLRRPLTGKS